MERQMLVIALQVSSTLATAIFGYDNAQVSFPGQHSMHAHESSGKTNSAIYHYRSLYTTICDLCCNKCNNSIMASIALPPYL